MKVKNAFITKMVEDSADGCQWVGASGDGVSGSFGQAKKSH